VKDLQDFLAQREEQQLPGDVLLLLRNRFRWYKQGSLEHKVFSAVNRELAKRSRDAHTA
jgi:hypothetical protein